MSCKSTWGEFNRCTVCYGLLTERGLWLQLSITLCKRFLTLISFMWWVCQKSHSIRVSKSHHIKKDSGHSVHLQLIDKSESILCILNLTPGLTSCLSLCVPLRWLGQDDKAWRRTRPWTLAHGFGSTFMQVQRNLFFHLDKQRVGSAVSSMMVLSL